MQTGDFTENALAGLLHCRNTKELATENNGPMPLRMYT